MSYGERAPPPIMCLSIFGSPTLKPSEIPADGLFSPQLQSAEGPVFQAPWEAQAFALTVKLHEGGAFTWAEWTEALSDQVSAAETSGDPDLGDTYYAHWLAALEALVIAKGFGSRDAISDLTEAWRRAYLRTPHGQPVELAAGKPTPA